jgi:hypothetical protein
MGFQDPWQLLQARGEPSFKVAGTLGPACQHRLPGATASAVDMGDPSLQSAGVPGPACQVPASRIHRNFCSHGRTKAVVNGSPGACLLVYQEPWQLLQAWGTHACMQREPGGCLQVWLARSHSSCCRHREFWGLLAGHALQEGSSVALLARGKPAFR